MSSALDDIAAALALTDADPAWHPASRRLRLIEGAPKVRHFDQPPLRYTDEER